ncbi:MAG: NADPH-dependent assimilatory sulfite reductase hemoprotein subunit [Verrucomicrobia bacterium]|nr:NADPH-dependent assimilatory sulfite reductase hemoprotein subunit [Verrucomicrobiota bacterium]
MTTEPKKLTKNEELKQNCPTLAGTISQTLTDPELDRFSEDDQQFLKFHGIYQQDDRDLRKQGKKFMFMIRGRIPGGVMSPELYLTYDKLATDYGNNTLRVTTRQSFQFHGVVKSGLGPLMKKINDILSDTLAACGDVNRNVMSPVTPTSSPLVPEVYKDADLVSRELLPKTKAYHQIWVEGVQLDLEKEKDFEDPLYGKTYLPRKFKAAFAIPPLNDTDILTNCLGFIAIADEHGQLSGYNLTCGGGMGMTHNNANTFPRVADVIGYFSRDRIVEIAKAVLTVHRDFGDRTDRKHARLKYVLEEKGVAWFRSQVEERVGFQLEAARPFQFSSQHDLYGWHQQHDGKHFLGLHVLSGRVKDTESVKLKSAIREVVEKYRVHVLLTPSQNILIPDISADHKEAITGIFNAHGVVLEGQGSHLGRTAMSCPALPTCGLALAESERYLPELLGTFENLLDDLSIGSQEIIIRMTGCPNGCARPYMAELGFVGRGPGKYSVFVGGNRASTRLGRIYKDVVKSTEVVEDLKPLFVRYRDERLENEDFGDFCARVIFPELEKN